MHHDYSHDNGKPLRYEPNRRRFLCDLNAINGSEGSRNNNIIMPPCKKPGFMLHQVRRPADRQTTLKMPVSWMEFGLIRAMLCWDVFPKLTRFSDFLANFPPQQLLIYLVSEQVDVLSYRSVCPQTSRTSDYHPFFHCCSRMSGHQQRERQRREASATQHRAKISPIFSTMLAWQEFLPLFRHLFLKMVDLNTSKPRQKNRTTYMHASTPVNVCYGVTRDFKDVLKCFGKWSAIMQLLCKIMQITFMICRLCCCMCVGAVMADIMMGGETTSSSLSSWQLTTMNRPL